MTAREVYNRAIALINERNGGGAYHDDVEDFEKNAPEVMNSIITLLWPSQCIIEKKRLEALSWDFSPIGSMDDEIPLHIALASGPLPFALASFLLLEEDAQRADYFYSLFRKSEENVVKTLSYATHGKIRDVYSGEANGT